MRKFGLMAAVMAAFLLGGCQTITDTLERIDPFKETDSVLKYCEVYEFELNVLATLIEQEKLTVEHIAVADKAIEVIGPVCTQPSPPNNKETILIVKKNIEVLTGLREEVE